MGAESVPLNDVQVVRRTVSFLAMYIGCVLIL